MNVEKSETCLENVENLKKIAQDLVWLSKEDEILL